MARNNNCIGSDKPQWRRTFSLCFLFVILAVLVATNWTVDAFLNSPLVQLRTQKSAQDSSLALGLLRPDWMRRAGRIEEKRKERRDMFESLRKRQEELGIKTNRMDKPKKDTKPRMYIAVSPNSSSNGTAIDDDDDDQTKKRLPIYAFVPEDEVEAKDESNVLDWLEHGEIVKAIRTEKAADASVPPPRMAVVAATVIYNVPSKIRTDIVWIEHDRGGWSPTMVDGVKRLIPIDDAGESDNRNQ